ncbi:hypothetical protein K503DRAFT_806345 [Rhizopogon vinicolor AM-OR11-026]|uniref:Uncharacterized protein n=1 Tax=Rhizopogon vinicolor AM-OR11-026 TaxID=1314800 RepID=A0A1B7MEW3_9AGAM|nr:hypothetical protein K503DRAFT_806345 [Rhizopogon vinicolor AM-OR11-026]
MLLPFTGIKRLSNTLHFGMMTSTYVALSIFLWNHYQEALTAIQALTAEFSALKDVLNLMHADFIHFHKQEHLYLNGLKDVLLKDRVSVQYVQALDEVAVRQEEWNSAREAANHALVDIHLQNAEAMASHLEIQLKVDKQWELGSEPYNHFRQEALLLNYRTALDELEQLIVMHLFELSKLSLSGTGYKQRQQISKALQ